MKIFLYLIILFLNLTNVIIGLILIFKKRKKFYEPLFKELPSDAYDNYRKNVLKKEDKKDIEIREFW